MSYKLPNRRLVNDDLFSRVESVTPALAQQWLARNFKNNRPLRRQKVERLAEDMRAGRWLLTHQSIAFNHDGELIDGQHRLAAVVESGATVSMLVFFNVPMDGVELIDCGDRRTDLDALVVGGVKTADRHRVAVARAVYENGRISPTPLSRSVFREFFLRHKEAVGFAVDSTRGNPPLMGGAPVMAPIARAWYSQDRDRLAEFADQVRTGVGPRDEDNAGTTLFRFIASHKQQFNAARGRAIVYRKATAALAAFLEHRPCSRLYEMHPSPFAIPGDEERVDDDE